MQIAVYIDSIMEMLSIMLHISQTRVPEINQYTLTDGQLVMVVIPLYLKLVAQLLSVHEHPIS